MGFKTIWAWLGNPKNQKTIALIVGTLVTGWATYHKVDSKPESANKAPVAATPQAVSQPASTPVQSNANNNGQQAGSK